MPIRRVLNFTNFRGGLVTAVPKSNLASGYFSRLENWYLLGGKIKTRPRMIAEVLQSGGTIFAAGTPLAEYFYGYEVVGTTSPAEVVLRRTKFSKYTSTTVGTNYVDLTDPMTVGIDGAGNVWRSVTYKGYGYAVNKAQNGIIRFDDTSLWSTGIAAPSTAAVLADGGAGGADAGAFIGVFTFVDASGAESSPSPVSNTLTLAASRSRAWSSVDVSTNPRVVARNLYATLPDQKGEYFFVGQIPDNVTTTFSESLNVSQMGDLLDTERPTPVSTPYRDIAAAYERLWAIDAARLYGSGAEAPDAWPGDNVFQLGPDDSESNVGLDRMNDGTLILLKSGSVWALDQSLGAFEFLPRLVDHQNGLVSSQAHCVAGRNLYWASERAIFYSDGRSPGIDITTGIIDFSADTGGSPLGSLFNEAMTLAYHPEKEWLIIGLTPYGSLGGALLGVKTAFYAYDIARKYWFRLSWKRSINTTLAQFDLPIFIKTSPSGKIVASFTNATGTPVGVVVTLLLAVNGTDDHYIGDTVLNKFYSFDTARIESTFVMNGLNFEAPGLRHAVGRVLISCDDPTEDVARYPDTNAQLLSEISVVREGGRVSSKTRTNVDISGTKQWKAIGLSARDYKTSESAIKVVRNSRYEFAIEAIQVHADLWGDFVKE